MKEFKFTINGNLYKVDVLETEGNLTKIEVNGVFYNVELHREAPKASPVRVTSLKQKRSVSDSPAGKSNAPSFKVKAPLPGIIIQVLVKVGEEVTAGQTLCTLETMKMENAIKTEKGGKITAVKVSPGQSVNQEEVLVEIN